MSQKMLPQRIVVLLGYDGCGKSTLIENLQKDGYPVSSWRCLRAIPELEYIRPATITPSLYREELPPLTRSCFLLSALFAEYEFSIQPTLQKYGFVVVDSYYLRPLAKEIIKGKASATLLLTAHSLLPPPSLVIVCNVSIETAYKRKQRPSLNEVFTDCCSFVDFKQFQTRVLEKALSFVDATQVEYIDCECSPEQAYTGLIGMLNSQCEKG